MILDLDVPCHIWAVITENSVNAEAFYPFFLQNPQICTDSRQIEPGCLFFALQGENHNGNLYATEALEKGAVRAIVDDPNIRLNDQMILVDNVLGFLQSLALHHRKQLNIPVVAITGSNGKTTTKELVKSVLRQQYHTIATSGNLNNHIGVPLTILKADQTTEMLVVEMGANHPGEIRDLCHLALPTHGLITNIGKAHLEGFGSLEGVKKAKGELFEFVAATDGVFFLNHDDYQLIDLVDSYPTCSYGTREPCQIRIRLTQSIPTLRVLWLNPGESGPISISSHLSGDYHLSNIGAAIAVGHHFGLDPDRVATGIESYVPDNMRSQWIDTGRNRVLLDAYNANPTSMEAAIRLVVSMDSQNCLLILGDMFELGTTSSKEHWELLSLIDKLGLEQVMLVGKEFDRFREEFPFMFFKTFELLQDFLKDFGPTDSLILVKGSRGMRMERVVPYL